MFLLHIITLLNLNSIFYKYSLTSFCFSDCSCSKFMVWVCQNTTVGDGEQEECRCSCNVVHFKIHVEFRSYFAVFAQMTGKKHKAQIHIPHSSEYMGHIHFMSSLYVQSKYCKCKQYKPIYICLLSPCSFPFNGIL